MLRENYKAGNLLIEPTDQNSGRHDNIVVTAFEAADVKNMVKISASRNLEADIHPGNNHAINILCHGQRAGYIRWDFKVPP
jgi:hypothetical protein